MILAGEQNGEQSLLQWVRPKHVQKHSYGFCGVTGTSSNASHQVYASGLTFDYDPSYRN